MQMESGPFVKTFQHCFKGGGSDQKRFRADEPLKYLVTKGKAGARNCKIRADELFHERFYGKGPETQIKNTEFKFVAGLTERTTTQNIN